MVLVLANTEPVKNLKIVKNLKEPLDLTFLKFLTILRFLTILKFLKFLRILRILRILKPLTGFHGPVCSRDEPSVRFSPARGAFPENSTSCQTPPPLACWHVASSRFWA